jgi:uroporphyrinogen decarboxylase
LLAKHKRRTALPWSHRKRVFAAVDLEEPDTVPITDLGMDPPVVEGLTGETTHGFSIEGFSAGHIEVGEICKKNMLAMARAYRKLGLDAVIVSDESIYRHGFVPRFLDENTFVDEWGRVMMTRSDTKTTWWVGGTIKTPEDLENYEPPDANAPGRMEVFEAVIKEVGEDMVVAAGGHTGFSLAWRVRGGIDKYIVDVYTNPSFAKKLMDKVVRACLEWDKAIMDTGVEMLALTDDYSGTDGPFFSPKLFREIEIPNLKSVVDEAKRKGVPVLKHTDGNNYPILDDMVDTGISGLHPMEPGAMDIAQVKQRYGDRIFLGGNVDCRWTLPYGSEEDVRTEVRRVIDAASPGGGHILMSSNTLHANVKPQNVLTMIQEARKYGKYPR